MRRVFLAVVAVQAVSGATVQLDSGLISGASPFEAGVRQRGVGDWGPGTFDMISGEVRRCGERSWRL